MPKGKSNRLCMIFFLLTIVDCVRRHLPIDIQTVVFDQWKLNYNKENENGTYEMTAVIATFDKNDEVHFALPEHKYVFILTHT